MSSTLVVAAAEISILVVSPPTLSVDEVPHRFRGYAAAPLDEDRLEVPSLDQSVDGGSAELQGLADLRNRE